MFTPDVNDIVAVMAGRGYRVYDAPSYDLNLVGIRCSRKATNAFTDTFAVFYKSEGRWKAEYFPCTTSPGWAYLEEPMDKDGCAIVVPGQYRSAYGIGLHKGQYKALVQIAPVTVYRDADRDHELDYVNPETGLFGINIHRGNPTLTSRLVDKWSAGCCVLSSPGDFKRLMELADRQVKAMHGSKFTYTLLEKGDF